MLNTLGEVQAAPHEGRIKTLDSMRGLASLTVLLGHVLASIFPNGNFWLDKTPLHIISSSHEAVVFFFLLSGYVLTYQYANKSFEYKSFLIGRVARIYIPYIVAVLLSLVLYTFFKDNAPVHYNNFLKSQWQFTYSNSLLVDHILLVGNFKTDTINTVIWSLVHEMRVAILFPVLLLILKLNWRIVICLSLLVSVLAGFAIVHGVNPSAGYNNSYVYTCHYFSMFLLGALLARYQSFIISKYRSIPKLMRNAMLVTALLVYTTSHLTFSVLHVLGAGAILKYSFLISDWLTSIASFHLMVAAIAVAGTKHWVESKPLLKLGKVSYSLYLVHLPVLYVVYKLMPTAPFELALGIGTVLSLYLSTIFNKLVELPAAKLGKKAIHLLSRYTIRVA
ncbi:acyltransferase [Mucilaginibacter sp. PAMB04274]|uniref:acyltransferase family protein n=1 Tax=Mucilaginibacter sp. PAMB04274 TaxID=3138568 RepID=UPI0031F6B8AA